MGDNKALNDLLKFSKSFSYNCLCRFCDTHKKDTQIMTRENLGSLRTEANYNEMLLNKEYSTSGVKGNSSFNSISSFHVTENFSVDVMHDAF